MAAPASERETTDAIWFVDNLMFVRVSGEETDGRFSLVEGFARESHMPPLHIHHREDETFVVLEGEITLYAGDTVRRMKAGEAALGPKGVPHTFRVESETARWLVACAPAGFERFVTAVGEPAEELVIPAEPVIPGGPERMEVIAREFGIELVGPPGTLPS